MKLIRTVLLFILPLYFISCSTQKPLPNYLDKLTDSTYSKTVVIPELRIQKNDNLFIQVYSASTDPHVDEVYNLRSTGGGATSAGQTSSSGFLVDQMGNIEYPHIGLIRAEGLSRLELGDVIKRRLNEKDSVLTDPVVIVRFTNLKVAVLGEVKNPGVITMPGERVTILEALGLAGDISEYGKKDEVVVVRETNGKRDIGKIDLSSDSLFLSPYYQLTQNDIVLVEPSIRKAKRAEEALLLQRVSLGLSVLTAIALLYSIFR